METLKSRLSADIARIESDLKATSSSGKVAKFSATTMLTDAARVVTPEPG